MQLVCFFLGDQELAVPIAEVRETVALRPITPVFGTPPCVAGIANLRGEILAILDPARLLGLGAFRAADSARIVIVEPDAQAAGLLVERLGGIREVPDDALAPAPATTPAQVAALLAGIVSLQERPVAVLDTSRLLGAPELAPYTDRPRPAGAGDTADPA